MELSLQIFVGHGKQKEIQFSGNQLQLLLVLLISAATIEATQKVSWWSISD